MDNNATGNRKGTSFGRLILRFIVAAIVLWVVAAFTPGYRMTGFWTPLIQAVVIVGLDYVVQALTGIDASPFGRGFLGFVMSAIIIYLTQFIVPGLSLNIIGAVIAALLIGVVEALLPVNVI
jgi:uncharacterized membrane protein YvlD (DUF360 family)